MRRLILALVFAASLAEAHAADVYGPYRANLVRVIDGDTVELAVQIWPQLISTVHVRVLGVNAPEMHAKAQCERDAAAKAAAFTKALLEGASEIVLTDVRPDKYGGRVDGKIVADGKDLSQALLKADLARAYAGGKRERWCE